MAESDGGGLNPFFGKWKSAHDTISFTDNEWVWIDADAPDNPAYGTYIRKGEISAILTYTKGDDFIGYITNNATITITKGNMFTLAGSRTWIKQ
jgi:hypothetical protein